MKQVYEVTAWRQETYSTAETFKADTPEDALAQAKTDFENEIGESCCSGEPWTEFLVSRNGEQVLVENIPDLVAKLLEALIAASDWIDAQHGEPRIQVQAKIQQAIAEATGRAA